MSLEDKNLKFLGQRSNRISIFSYFLLVLSIILFIIGTFGFVLSLILCGSNAVRIALFSLMFLGLILVIISHTLRKNEEKLFVFAFTGIIGFLLVVGFFIGAYFIVPCTLW